MVAQIWNIQEKIKWRLKINIKDQIKNLINKLDSRDDLLEISYFITQKEVKEHIKKQEVENGTNA